MQPTYLIVGYFGYDLVGDDAVLISTMDDLKKKFDNSIFIITSADCSKNYGANVRAIPINDLGKIVEAIEEADLVLVGGGGIFNEDNPYHASTFMSSRQQFNALCASVPFLSRCLSTPCMIFGVGVFSLVSEQFAEHLRHAFDAANVATVRDNGSIASLREAGVDLSRVEVAADPVFRLEFEELAPALQLTIDKLRQAPGPLLVVSARHWNLKKFDMKSTENAWEGEVAIALDGFIESSGGSCLFLPFQSSEKYGSHGDDLPVMQRILQQMRNTQCCEILATTVSPKQTLALIKSCDMALAMRFHSVVMAIRSSIPLVALSYSPKVRATLSDFGLDDCVIDLEEVNGEKLLKLMMSRIEKCEIYGSSVEKIADDAYRKAARNIELAMTLFELISVGVFPHGLSSKPADEKFAAKLLVRNIKNLSVFERAFVASQASNNRSLSIALGKCFIELDPSDVESALNTANLLSQQYLDARQSMDAIEAEKLFTKVIDARHNLFWAFHGRAAIRYHLSKYEQARADIGQALDLNPNHEGAIQIRAAIEDKIQP